MIWAILAAAVAALLLAGRTVFHQIAERTSKLEAEKMAHAFKDAALKEAADKTKAIEGAAQQARTDLATKTDEELERLVNE